jgi:tetratricopeptide (TPR) repeat protein
MIGYLWARLYLGRALDEAERAEELEERLDRLTQQHRDDAQAISLTRSQLSDDAARRPSQDELDKAIANASVETKPFIYYLAEGLRRKHWVDKRGVMERARPIFQALIKSDKEEAFHRNYGQLGYIYKDQRNPDWKEAIRNLSKAIELRGSAEEHAWHEYEANRAICRIRDDSDFANDQPTAKDVKQLIIDDLKVGASGYWTEDWLKKDEYVIKWLKMNKVDEADIFD